MLHYIEFNTKFYEIYLRFVAPEDIHVYSIDEVFIDATGYFKQDKIKSGGSFAVVTGRIVKLDEYDKTITLSSGVLIGMEDIVSITFSPSSKR